MGPVSRGFSTPRSTIGICIIGILYPRWVQNTYGYHITRMAFVPWGFGIPSDMVHSITGNLVPLCVPNHHAWHLRHGDFVLPVILVPRYHITMYDICAILWAFGTPIDIVPGYHIDGDLIPAGVLYHHV